MALKALLLRKKIDGLKKSASEMDSKLEELRNKSAEFETRESELEAAVNEVTDETPAEDKAAVEEEVTKFDADKTAHEADLSAAEKERKDIGDVIASTEKELSDLESEQEDKDPEVQTPESDPTEEPTEARKVIKIMNKRYKDMSFEERSAFVKNEDVHAFLENVRALGKGQAIEKRSLTGGDLLIPEVVLPLIKSETEQYSKLMKHVNVKKVNGTARQTIEGGIPEGVWTEACANVNELALIFTDVEVDGYKCGGFIPVCNATLEDSDVNLANEIFTAIGQGIGYAIDKAIVYGTGTKMPTGFAATATKSNVGGSTDTAMFKKIIKATGALKHANGDMVWVMNSQTKADIVAASMSIDAAGAIVAGVNSQMPIIGGTIETLDFVPADEILGGYGMDYLLAERAGTTLGTSEHVKFMNDQTVFKGEARYDGKPAFADGFIAIGLGSTDPTAAIDPAHPFASDAANA